MTKVEEFCLLKEDDVEVVQFYFEDEDDDENDVYEIVNPTRPRSRPR